MGYPCQNIKRQNTGILHYEDDGFQSETYWCLRVVLANASDYAWGGMVQ